MVIKDRLLFHFVKEIEKKGAKRWNNVEVMLMLMGGVLLQ